MELDSFERETSKLIEYLEGIIRGGSIRGVNVDLDRVLNLAHDLLIIISDDDATKEGRNISDSKRKDLSSLAVKLNTKARALSTTANPDIIKLRNFTKAISAWIVFQFHEPSVKALQIVIPILGSVAHEIDRVSLKLMCCRAVSKAWDMMNRIPRLDSQVSSLQMQDLKTFVFESCLEEAKLSLEIKSSESFDASGRAVEKALELSQSMNVMFSVTLIERVLNFAITMANSAVILDLSKHFFLSVLRIIQSREAEIRELKNETFQDVMMMKYRSLLALAYISTESGEFEKAKSYVQSVSENAGEKSESMKITLFYAKFSIFVREDDWLSAETYFHSLLRQSITFDMAMDIVKTYVTKYGTIASAVDKDYDEINSIFKVLSNKFKSDAEQSMLKVTELQSLIFCYDSKPSKDLDVEDKSMAKLIDKANAVVQDHILNRTKLSAELTETLRNTFLGRIKHHRLKFQWGHVIKWCEITLPLFRDTSTDEFNLVTMHFINAYNKQQQYIEALEMCKSFIRPFNTAAVIMISFQSAINVLSPSATVSFLLEKLDENKDTHSTTKQDDMIMILRCYSMINDGVNISSLGKKIAQTLLLKIWIKVHLTFIREQSSLDDSDVTADQPNLLKVVSKYLQHFKDTVTCNEVENAASERPTEASENVISQKSDMQLTTKKIQDNALQMTSNNIPVQFKLLCDLLVVKSIVLDIMDEIVNTYNKFKSTKLFGNEREMEWIGTYLWQFGCSLTRCDKLSLNIDQSITSEYSAFISESMPHVTNTSQSDRLLLASDFFEMAERCFSCMLSGDKSAIASNQIMCLIISCASRIDAESLIQNGNEEMNTFPSMNLSERYELSMNLSKARSSIIHAQTLLRNISDNDDSHSLNQLQNISLILEFSLLCKASPPIQSSVIEDFITCKTENFLCLTVDELITCADIATSEPSGTVELTRRMYAFALQISIRDGNSKANIGNLYAKLIELSPTRAEALSRLKEFYQILSRRKNELSGNSLETSEDDFTVADVDRICSLCYNYSVTLQILEQYNFAADFVTMSLQILEFCSEMMRGEWKTRIQDTFAFILSKQSSNQFSMITFDTEKSTTKSLATFNNSATILRDTYVTSDALS